MPAPGVPALAGDRVVSGPPARRLPLPGTRLAVLRVSYPDGHGMRVRGDLRRPEHRGRVNASAALEPAMRSDPSPVGARRSIQRKNNG